MNGGKLALHGQHRDDGGGCVTIHEIQEKWRAPVHTHADG